MQGKTKNLRKYGSAPYQVAVLHGGPGAPGEMAPVAKKLCSHFGVLEPLQTKSTISGQIKELKTILDKNSFEPITLIGWSWGAWLGFIFAAKFPKYVKKLILVGSGPFEEKYAKDIMKTRFERLSKTEQSNLKHLMQSLTNPNIKNKTALMKKFGGLTSKADSYQALPHHNNVVEFQLDIYNKVWSEASKLRSSKKLLEYSKNVQCPIVAIHGDYDPHPYEGVKIPLSKILDSFKFILLDNCGHYPWYEKLAKDKFYKILIQECGY
jgi:pimeloyl-ACP methyl ester carboxylesterase